MHADLVLVRVDAELHPHRVVALGRSGPRHPVPVVPGDEEEAHEGHELRQEHIRAPPPGAEETAVVDDHAPVLLGGAAQQGEDGRARDGDEGEEKCLER